MSRLSLALIVLFLASVACDMPLMPLNGSVAQTEAPTMPLAATVTPTSGTPESGSGISSPTVMPLAATATPTSGIVDVTAIQALHVRAKPNAESLSLAYLLNGETVTLTGTCSHGWAQIIWKDSTAWVKSNYISGDPCP